jgi:hypothetical protein
MGLTKHRKRSDIRKCRRCRSDKRKVRGFPMKFVGHPQELTAILLYSSACLRIVFGRDLDVMPVYNLGILAQEG